MDSDKIKNIISNIIPQTKIDGDKLKKKTVKDTYHVGGLSGNRLNSGTLRSQFIICDKESVWINCDDSAKKAIHSDQRVFVQREDDVWDVYKGKLLEGESEFPELIYEKVHNLKTIIEKERETLGFKSQLIELKDVDSKGKIKYFDALRTKPFLLLAGISGTGKSRIVRELAFMSCPKELQDEDGTTPGNYCMIEVKPNWHDSTELLGYYSNIRGKYMFTPFVKFLIKAKKYPSVPFFVCLDEMNLAPVEQYFAEFLSVLETRKLKEIDNILSGPIIKKDFFDFISVYNSKVNYVEGSDLEGSDDKVIASKQISELDLVGCDDICSELLTKGLTLPDNVFVIGTVNMDDTTYKFSRKVIDRAMTIEMNGGKLHEMFGHSSQLSYRDDVIPLEMFKPKYVTADDAINNCDSMHEFQARVMGSEDDTLSVASRLKAINDCLIDTPFQVSYRVLNELVIYLAVLLDAENNEVDEDKFNKLLDKAIDDITLMKILPRIEGDDEMFELKDGTGYSLSENRFDELLKVVPVDGNSYKKIQEMQIRLLRSSFTRFWP